MISSVTDAHPRSAGPTYQDYLDADSHPVPGVLRAQLRPDLGTAPLEAARYTSQAFFELEAERLWPKVWQMACREEEVAQPGDAVVYDILGYSWIIVRGQDRQLRALANSCLQNLLPIRNCMMKYQQNSRIYRLKTLKNSLLVWVN